MMALGNIVALILPPLCLLYYNSMRRARRHVGPRSV